MCSFNYIILKIMGPEQYAKRSKEKSQQFVCILFLIYIYFFKSVNYKICRYLVSKLLV